MLKLYLIRHGECEMNLDLASKVGGRSNSSPLTPLGEKQARALGRHLARHLASSDQHHQTLPIFSSTAVRAYDTARLMAHELACTINSNSTATHQITATDQLLEQDMGEWQGALRRDVYTPQQLKIIEADTHNFRAPGGESQRDVEERMMAFITCEVLPAAAASPLKLAIVVGHGMAFKCVLRHLLNSDARMSRKIAIGNTAVTEMGWVPSGGEGGGARVGQQAGWHILRVNDMAHLNQT